MHTQLIVTATGPTAAAALADALQKAARVQPHTPRHRWDFTTCTFRLVEPAAPTPTPTPKPDDDDKDKEHKHKDAAAPTVECELILVAHTVNPADPT